MAGRKTIMVDGGVWNKVEELKHNAFLRSSGDAIETAVDIVTSDKYYAGIKAQKNDSGRLYYVVESLGRTEDEAVRNLLKLEQGSVYGNLKAEDIPPADETDITKPGFFVVECTERMYYEGKRFIDPETWRDDLREALELNEYAFIRNLFTCAISKSKTGTLMADVEYLGRGGYFVVVERLNKGKIARIVDYDTSFVVLHREFLVDYTPEDDDSYDDGDPYYHDPFYHDLYSSYNAGNYEILECSDRLFAECVGETFQSIHELYLRETDSEWDSKLSFPEFFGILRVDETNDCSIIDNRFVEVKGNKLVVDTTPEGHYYAVLVIGKDGVYGVLNVGDTANKAAKTIFNKSPIIIENDRNKMVFKPGNRIWSSVEENGERIGKYNGADICLVECTVEVYAKYLMKKENEAVICTVEEVDGHKLAKFKKMEDLSKEISEMTAGDKTESKKTDSKKTSAKKTAGEETTKAKKTSVKKTAGKETTKAKKTPAKKTAGKETTKAKKTGGKK